MVDTLQFRADTALSTALQTAADRQGVSLSEAIRGPLQRAYCQPRPVYGVGSPHSLVHDAGVLAFYGGSVDPEADDRLAQFRRQQREGAQFAINVGNASAAIAPGYRPESYLQDATGRPLVAASRRETITDATPFSVPRFTSSTGEVAVHVEGVNPTEGALTLNTATVNPLGYSGTYRLTRELVDAATPAADAVAMAAMRAQYNELTEAVVYGELNGSTGQGGTITSGRVPSGAWVVGAVTIANAPAEVRNMAALSAFRHPEQARIRTVALNSPATDALADVATTDRWLTGVTVVPAPAMTGTTASDGAVFGLTGTDLWTWESPTLELRFEERAGPAFVDLALFGYFAARLLRPAGLAAIRLSGS